MDCSVILLMLFNCMVFVPGLIFANIAYIYPEKDIYVLIPHIIYLIDAIIFMRIIFTNAVKKESFYTHLAPLLAISIIANTMFMQIIYETHNFYVLIFGSFINIILILIFIIYPFILACSVFYDCYKINHGNKENICDRKNYNSCN